MNNVLVVFARKPELGKVKTRLAKSLGDESALKVYTTLLEKTLETAHKTTAIAKTYWSSENKVQSGYLQKGANLGERMLNALTDEVSSSTKVCLIGTDTPNLTANIIEKAFQLLADNDIVFGPSIDGGYYLVALKKYIPKELFLDQKWSHPYVLKDALEACKTLHIKVALLPSLMDIDTIEDYKSWMKSNG